MGSSGTEYLIILLILCIERSRSLESSKPTVSWVRPGILTHQSLHSVLVSMEERLRGLENMKYTTNRLDLYLETFSRQLDSLDVRTRAVQIKLEQLENVAQNLVSHEMKNDLSTVHLQRKFETNQDRLIHKISLTENRLDSSITKLQGTIDLGFDKMEKKQNEFQNKLNNMNVVLDVVSLRMMNIEDYSNATTHAVQHGKIADLEDSRNHHMSRITDMLEGIEKHVNKSILYLDQNDSPRNLPKENETIKELIRTEFHTEANKIGNKINNMYNDLWSKTTSIENIMKDVVNSSSITKVKTHDNSESTADDIRCSETIESVMRETVGTLGGFLQEKLESMDTNLEGVFATHKMLLGAYNKMREDENQFESRLTYVLGKILDTIENRTKAVDEMQRKTFEALKNHNNQVVRTVAYNTNSLKKLAEDSGLEHKHLDSYLGQLINFMTPDKHESQEYEDNPNDLFRKVGQNEEKDTKAEKLEDVAVSHQLVENQRKTDDPRVNNTILKDVKQHSNLTVFNEKDEELQIYDKMNIDTFPEENITNEFDDKYSQEKSNTSPSLEDENDKAVTRLLMLYLKTLKGHLTKEKFLYEANPLAPYSSVQDMIKKLKEKNFPSDFLKELEEWDSETTNDKEAIEDINDVKEFTDNPNEDYYPDKEYLD